MLVTVMGSEGLLMVRGISGMMGLSNFLTPVIFFARTSSDTQTFVCGRLRAFRGYHFQKLPSFGRV